MSIPAQITPLPTAKTAPTVAELVATRVELKADMEYIQGRIDEIDAQIIAALGTVGTHDVDGTKVQVREYSSTDKARLQADYPAEQFPQLYELTLSTAALRKQFAPAALDAYRVTGKRSVVIA